LKRERPDNAKMEALDELHLLFPPLQGTDSSEHPHSTEELRTIIYFYWKREAERYYNRGTQLDMRYECRRGDEAVSREKGFCSRNTRR